MNDFGKELQRVARYKNHHHFNFRCNKSDLIPSSLRIQSAHQVCASSLRIKSAHQVCVSSLRIKSPVDTDCARSAANRATKVFLQERIKVMWRLRNAALITTGVLPESLMTELSKDDFEKVERICTCTADTVFKRFKERQRRKFDKMNERRIPTAGCGNKKSLPISEGS